MPMGDVEVAFFLRVVRVIAPDRSVAEAIALNRVQSEWDASPNARLNRGLPPQLRIGDAALLSWWRRFQPSRRGYIFAPDDGE
jgi:hypothetical protein